MESAIELFESSDEPNWRSALSGSRPLKTRIIPHLIEDGCDIGDECLFYYYQSLDPATNVTKLDTTWPSSIKM